MTQNISMTRTAEVDIEVCLYDAECSKCGALLDFTARTDGDNDIRLSVDPCEHCLDKAKEE